MGFGLLKFQIFLVHEIPDIFFFFFCFVFFWGGGGGGKRYMPGPSLHMKRKSEYLLPPSPTWGMKSLNEQKTVNIVGVAHDLHISIAVADI